MFFFFVDSGLVDIERFEMMVSLFLEVVYCLVCCSVSSVGGVLVLLELMVSVVLWNLVLWLMLVVM